MFNKYGHVGLLLWKAGSKVSGSLLDAGDVTSIAELPFLEIIHTYIKAAASSDNHISPPLVE